MLAEKIKMAEGGTLPTWDEGCEWVRWKDRVFPFMTFYLIHYASAQLLDLLEFYPLKTKQVRERISWYIQEKNEFIVRSLPGISEEALMEAFYGSIAAKHYLLEEREDIRIRAMEHLIEIRRLLHFDELFQKWQSPLEKKLCQEQVQTTAQVVPLR